MKKLITILGIALAAMVIVGCSTTEKVITLPDGSTATNTTTRLDPVRTSNAIKAILPTAVTFAISQEPSSRVYIEKAQLAVCATASAGKFSPDELKAAIEATGVKEIQTPEVQTAIQAIYGIYQAYYGDVVAAKLNQNEWLVPVLSAICDGLRDGLNASKPQPVTGQLVITPATIKLP